MTVFEEVCFLSCEQWVDSFPIEVPKHEFSKQHEKTIKGILNGKTKTEKFKFSKNTIKILLIAAILLAITTTVFAIPISREFIIKKWLNHATYTVVDDSSFNDLDLIITNYVPDNFTKTDDYKLEYMHTISYSNKEYYFSVEKYTLNTEINFDIEEYDCEDIFINNKQGVFYKPDEYESGIIFNNGNFIFIISGNVGREELIKIAQGLE